MNAITVATNMQTDENENYLSAPEKNGYSEQRQGTLFGHGESSLTTALTKEQANRKRELTAPCSATKARIEALNLSGRRTQLLIAYGLIAGITPISIRKRLGLRIPATVSLWPDGSDADLQKAD